MNSAPAYSDQLVDAGVAQLATVQRGSGPPLVLLHGIPLSSLTWRNNLDALSRNFSITAIDLKGFGNSIATDADQDWSPAGHARAICAGLDRMGVDRVSFAANSYGCAPAAAFASLYPERVDGLVLINSVGTGEGSHRAERLARIGFATAVARPLLSSSMGRRLIAARLRRCYVAPPAEVDELACQYHRPLESASGVRAFLQSLRQFDEQDLASILSSLPHRTLLVWGARDPIVGLNAAYRLRAWMKNAQLAIFNWSGHFPHEEEPERFAEVVSGFLLSTPRR